MMARPFSQFAGSADFKDRRFRNALLGVVVLALVARVLYLVFRGALLVPDSYDYLDLAGNLLRGHGFSMDASPPFLPSIRRPPVYPLFLAAVSWTGRHQLTAVAVLQILADTWVTLAVILVARSVASPAIALGSGALYALHPGAVANCAVIQSECLFAALVLGGLVLVARGIDRQLLWSSALGGLVLGIAILCRAVALPLPLLIALALLFFPQIPRRGRHVLAMVSAIVLLVAPWAVRCTLAAGQPVLVQGTSGVMVYVAARYDWNQLDQTEVWHRFDRDPEVQSLGINLGTLSRGTTAAEVAEFDRALTKLARQRILAAPVAYLTSRVQGIPYFLLTSYETLPGTALSFGELRRGRQWLILAVKGISFILFSLLPLVLGLVGLLHARRNLVALCCAAIWVYTAVIYFPMWREPRYWLPAIPFLCVSVAIGVELLLQGSRSGQLTAGSLATALRRRLVRE